MLAERGGIALSPWRKAVHKGSHGSDGRVLTRRIVDMVPSQCKVRRQEGNALCFASTIHTTRNQLRLAREEGQEDSGGHGEVKITTVGQGVGRQPARQLTRLGEDPLWRDHHPRQVADGFHGQRRQR